MQNVTDIYPPDKITSVWAIAALVVSVGIAAIYVLLMRLARLLALQRQQRLAERQKPHAEQIIAEALRAIEKIQTGLTTNQLLPNAGAEQLSAIARQTYDALMNHTTMKQARYEIAVRKLDKLENLLNYGYPVEFANSQELTQAEAVRLCDAAREVIRSCT